MNSYKRLITTLVIFSVLVAGMAGIAVLLSLATVEEVVSTLTTTYLVFGVVALMSAVVIAVLKMNKSEE